MAFAWDAEGKIATPVIICMAVKKVFLMKIE